LTLHGLFTRRKRSNSGQSQAAKWHA